MAIDVGTFKGEAPRIAPRLLPNDMGQYSGNARLLSGNLESWKAFNTATTQTINANTLSIYYLDDQLWLTWNRTPGSIGTGVIKIWEASQATPFYDGTVGSLTSPTSTDTNDHHTHRHTDIEMYFRGT